MRIITWNCNMAFRNKKNRILEYDPDIIIIQECENPELKGIWDEFSDWVWIGDNKNKGLGVFTRNGFNVEILSNVNTQVAQYIIPVKVSGPTNLLLFPVWAMNDTIDYHKRYIGQVFTALSEYKDLLDSRSLIIGDFNWNVIWDKTSRSLCGNFMDTFAILESRGLTSVYHTLNNCSFGHESAYTFFMHKKISKPYHIDYVFIPRIFIENILDFWIGNYDDWIDVSDHMPIMLEMNPRQKSKKTVMKL